MSDPKNPWELPIHDPGTGPSIEPYLASLFPSDTPSLFHLSMTEILALPEDTRDTLARVMHVSCWNPFTYHVMGCPRRPLVSDLKDPWELPIHDPSTGPSIEPHLSSR